MGNFIINGKNYSVKLTSLMKCLLKNNICLRKNLNMCLKYYFDTLIWSKYVFEGPCALISIK